MYYFILNPSSQSSGSRSIWNRLATILKEKNISYKVYATTYPGHGTDLARKISTADPYATIVAIGGDGTVHDIFCGLTNISTITFGLIPSGSGNDFARGMHITSDTDRAIAQILDPQQHMKIDIGTITDKKDQRFGVSCGIGFDAAVCHEALSSPIKDTLNKMHLGQLTYGVIALKQILLYDPGPMTIEMDGGRKMFFKKAFFAAVMNQKYEGGGVKMCPEARPGDGILDIFVVSDIPNVKIGAVLPLGFAGKHKHLKGVHFLRAQSVKITCDRKRAVHLDGESGGMHRTLSATVLSEQLRVIVG